MHQSPRFVMKVSLLMHQVHKAAQICKDENTMQLQKSFDAVLDHAVVLRQLRDLKWSVPASKRLTKSGNNTIAFVAVPHSVIQCKLYMSIHGCSAKLYIPSILVMQQIVTLSPLSVYAECCHLRPASNRAYAASRSPSGAELVALASGSGLVKILPSRRTCDLYVSCQARFQSLFITANLAQRHVAACLLGFPKFQSTQTLVQAKKACTCCQHMRPWLFS